MHMADALITPVVGGVMTATTVGVTAYSIKKLDLGIDNKKIPLMGVMGAFIFAAQMINFAIPGTGSSGHIGGGLLLAIMLGPHAGFLVMASILLIQSLFFADGGILALGCNIFNLGFFACYIGYNFIYRPIVRKGYTNSNIYLAAILSAVIGLQLGSLGVVLQTIISGRTGFSLVTFLSFMQPIHLVIGLVEGLVTASVVAFLYKVSPELLQSVSYEYNVKSARRFKVGIVALLIAAVFIGGYLSKFASEDPDGLEWSIEKTEEKLIEE